MTKLDTAHRDAFERLQQDFLRLEGDWLNTNNPSQVYVTSEPVPLLDCRPMELYENARLSLLLLVNRGSRLLPSGLSLDSPGSWNAFLRSYCPLTFAMNPTVADEEPDDGDPYLRLAKLYFDHGGVPPYPPATQQERVKLDAVPGGIPLRDLSFQEICQASVAAIEVFLQGEASAAQSEQDWSPPAKMSTWTRRLENGERTLRKWRKAGTLQMEKVKGQRGMWRVHAKDPRYIEWEKTRKSLNE